MWRMSRLSIHATIVVSVLLASPLAAADGSDPETLFAEGSALIEQGRCAEALPKLEEAQRLDPGIGTQFNIAVCLQQVGRLGSAWRNFEQVARLAGASGKKQREEAARAKLEALKPKVPTLVIRSDEPGDVTIKVDGAIVNRDAWSFVPVDPGKHTIDASASTKQRWSSIVVAPAEGAKLDVVIPKLTIVERTKIVTVTSETSNKRRTLGFILGGVGVAGVAAAAVTGVLLLNAKSTADERCTPRCIDAKGAFDQEGADAVSRGKTLLPINAVAWGVAAVGLGAGAFFILTSSSSVSARKANAPDAPGAASAGAANIGVDAMVGPSGGALRVRF